MIRRTSPTLVGGLLAVGAALLWGVTDVFAKVLYAYQLTPAVVVWGRSIFAIGVLGGALAILRPADLRLRRQDVPYLLVQGLFGVGIFSWLMFTTFALTSVAIAVILLYTSPAFVTILGATVLREPIVRSKLAGLAATMIGLALVAGLADAGQVQVVPAAIVTGLGSGLCYAIYTLIGKRAVGRYSPWTIVFYGYVFGAIVQTFILLLTGAVLPRYLATALGLHVLFSAFILVAFCLFVAALGRIEASRASILATAEPVFAMFLAFLVFGETLTSWQVLGAALVLTGALVAQIPTRQAVAARARLAESSVE